MASHDGPCSWRSEGQSGPVAVFRCRIEGCGAEKPLPAGQPELDRRAVLQRGADVDKTLRALREDGRNPYMPFMPRRPKSPGRSKGK